MFDGCNAQNMLYLADCQKAFEVINKGFFGLIIEEMMKFNILSVILSNFYQNPTTIIPLIYIMFYLYSKIGSGVDFLSKKMKKRITKELIKNNIEFARTQGIDPILIRDKVE